MKYTISAQYEMPDTDDVPELSKLLEPIRRFGQQRPASQQEQLERMQELRTQGRKGCKAIRINMAFTPDNHLFIKTLARATGLTMTELTNKIITAYRREHPNMLGEAQKFIRYVCSREDL